MKNPTILAFSAQEIYDLFEIPEGADGSALTYKSYISNEAKVLVGRAFIIIDGKRFLMVLNAHNIFECILPDGTVHSAIHIDTTQSSGIILRSIVDVEAVDIFREELVDVTFDTYSTGILPDPLDVNGEFRASTLAVWYNLRATTTVPVAVPMEVEVEFSATAQTGEEFESFAKRKLTELNNIEAYGVANPKPC